MKKIELLAPAGSREALVAAIQHGCDAIYLGGKQFGARAFAANFSDEEIIEAIEYCHLYDVRVYVTINTIIFEEELEQVVEYISFLYKNDVDAIIMQDIGLFSVVKERFPDLEIHASTQMHIHNQAGIEWCKEQGMKRVVLARETPLEQIRKWKDIGVELEVFGHGALCVCYSGQCNMSSSIGSRSANRGECAQPCRLPYRLIRENEYIETDGAFLLSPKDLCTVENIGKFIESGIHSLKIEGRMKKAAYVAQIVSMYRRAIDLYYQKQSFDDLEEYLYEAKKIFNRTYTKGFLYQDPNWIQQFRPNHQGVIIGNVLEYKNKRMLIKLNDTLTQGDGIRILNTNQDDYGFQVERIYQNDLLIREAITEQIIELDAFTPVQVGATVVKTTDRQLEKKLMESQTNLIRRIPIQFQVEIVIGKPIQLKIIDNKQREATVSSSFLVEAAKNQPISKERIQEQLLKLNNTIFECADIAIEMNEKVFISIKELNELRREAISQLEIIRKKHYLTRAERITKDKVDIISSGPEYLIHVETAEQQKACEELGYSNLIISSKLNDLNKEGNWIASNVVNEESKYPDTPLVFVEELGGLTLKNRRLITGVSIPTNNTEVIVFLAKLGVEGMILSNELSDESILEMVGKLKQNGYQLTLYQQLYGHKILMHTKHCPIQVNCNKEKNCMECMKQNYYLENDKKQRFLLRRTTDDILQIYDERAIFKSVPISGTKGYLHFTMENYLETKEILKKYRFLF